MSRSKKWEELWGRCLSEHLGTDTLTIVWVSGTSIFTHRLLELAQPAHFPTPVPIQEFLSAHTPLVLGAPPVLWLRVASLLDALQSLVPCDCSRESLMPPCGRREASQSRGGPAELLLCSPRICRHVHWWSPALRSSLLPEQPERLGPAFSHPGGSHLEGQSHSSWLTDASWPCPCSRAALLSHCGGAHRLLSSP